MDVLGDTLNEIAEQKAGIIKKNVPVVTGKITKGPLRCKLASLIGKIEQLAPSGIRSQIIHLVFFAVAIH
jgi:folylpolyglutamate synthase/dihydropteroate synthase